MLVLSRKSGQIVHINGNIKVSVVEIGGSRVRLGIEAPRDVRILRSELAEWTEFSFAEPVSAETESDLA